MARPTEKQLCLVGAISELARRDLDSNGWVIRENADATLLSGLPC
jgi:hypothetical protein